VLDVASSVNSKTLGKGRNRAGAPVTIIARSLATSMVQPTSTTCAPRRSDRRSSNQPNGSAAALSTSSILASSVSPCGADASALVTIWADRRRASVRVNAEQEPSRSMR
jgi:hypothetical protein